MLDEFHLDLGFRQREVPDDDVSTRIQSSDSKSLSFATGACSRKLSWDLHQVVGIVNLKDFVIGSQNTKKRPSVEWKPTWTCSIVAVLAGCMAAWRHSNWCDHFYHFHYCVHISPIVTILAVFTFKFGLRGHLACKFLIQLFSATRFQMPKSCQI